MARGDEYRNFEELRGKERENVDYSVTARTVAGSKVAIVAPHGGGIEPLTAELADSIAGDDHNFYALRGLKNKGNKVLHITSHRFDDERAGKGPQRAFQCGTAEDGLHRGERGEASGLGHGA